MDEFSTLKSAYNNYDLDTNNKCRGDFLKKERYTQGIRNFAWELILKYNICSLPLDVFGLANNLEILTVPYSRLAQLSGMTAMEIIQNYALAAFYKSTPPERIYYNDTLEHQGFLRFSIMHELAHLLLQHLADDAEREKEAKMLAARLLQPLIVLDACGVASADELSALCGVSASAAGYRFKRLQERRAAGTIGMSRLERQVGAQFAPFIVSYRKSKNR
ncbi:ImmA/IrrE family metallo-endopeptidase [Oscillospiraceae bacterium OttesenSCG-928-F05]|nr:ImmA/IrrE family metallo-endopeptidase [Oscillospiraceae bacterium OttesenSCG-928-F05]